MSNQALCWAFSQAGIRSSTKFVLIAMSDCANEQALFYGSVAYLAKATNLNRKTILAALRDLESAGFVSDTELRKGRTAQIKVYQLNLQRTADLFEPPRRVPEQEQLRPETDSRSVEDSSLAPVSNSTETGTVPEAEQFQVSRETVPNFPGNSPENGTRIQTNPNQDTNLTDARTREDADQNKTTLTVGDVVELAARAGVPVSWLLKPDAIQAQKDIVAMGATRADVEEALQRATTTKAGQPFGVHYVRPIVSEIIARRNGYGSHQSPAAQRGAGALAAVLNEPETSEFAAQVP